MKIARVKEEMDIIRYKGDNINEIKDFIKNITGSDITIVTYNDSFIIEINNCIIKINKGDYIYFNGDDESIIGNIRIMKNINLKDFVVIDKIYEEIEVEKEVFMPFDEKKSININGKIFYWNKKKGKVIEENLKEYDIDNCPKEALIALLSLNDAKPVEG